MPHNLNNTLNYISDIKEDLRDALASRSVYVENVPFHLWADALRNAIANDEFNDETVDPKPNPIPVVPPVIVTKPVTPPVISSVSGVRIESIGFEYGSLPFDFTGEGVQELIYDGPLFADLPSDEGTGTKRMEWMDAVDKNPNGMWVSWLLWSYSGTGNPPYTPTVGIYTDEAKENQIGTAVYSDGKFYSLVDVSTFEIQGGNPASIGLIRLGVCAPIVDLSSSFQEHAVSPFWSKYPVYCYGGLFEMWNGKKLPCDSVERCSISNTSDGDV